MSKSAEKTTNKKDIIFIVEDDSFLVKAYQIKLEKEGMAVWVATDGKEALSFLEKEAPSLVMLDLMLPNVNGFDVLAAIRNNKQWKDVPVLVLTNLGQPQDVKRCKELKVSEYIVKANIRINDIIEKVKNAIKT